MNLTNFTEKNILNKYIETQVADDAGRHGLYCVACSDFLNNQIVAANIDGCVGCRLLDYVISGTSKTPFFIRLSPLFNNNTEARTQ